MTPKITIQPTPTASAIETRNFLTSHSVTDDQLMRELWNVSSGLPGILDARRPGSAPRQTLQGEKDFVYDPAKNKYRRAATDRAVSENEIRSAVAKASNEAKNRIRQETQQMMAGAILFVVWYQRTRSILKALYRAVYVITAGGVLFEDDATRNAFYLWIILMFERLDQMKIAIETGTMAWNGRIVSSIGSLARSANGQYQGAKLERGVKKGDNEARRILGENENHCHDSKDKPGCIELAALGWMPIHKMVPLFGTTCRNSCMCQIETRKNYND